jgi:hypothetical protein
MFDWFKKPDYSNVVKFPAPAPYIVPPPQEKEAETMYSIGVTNDNHMTLKMGYSTLTMTKAGCHNLIVQLQVFKDQLRDEEHDA